LKGILAKEAANEKAYADAIAAGDLSLKDKKYDAAKKSYQAAATLKAGEAYPKDKISEIDGLLAKQAKQEQAYTAAIAFSRPSTCVQRIIKLQSLNLKKQVDLKPAGSISKR